MTGPAARRALARWFWVSGACAVLLSVARDHARAEASNSTTPPSAGSASGALDCRPGPGVRLERVGQGFERPVLLLSPPGEDRLFVVEQGGRIRPVDGGGPGPKDLLDLRDRVAQRGSERGLLGAAFHPRWAENGRLFVHYSDARDGRTVIAEYRPDAAEPRTERRLLEVQQPYANHNGGTITFSPKDGRLYVLLGDGGSGGDPENRAQNPATPLGKILRLDVDSPPASGHGYVVPPDNPFVGVRGAVAEIWALGVRNPWRGSFDPVTGDLWFGDVGQNAWEEIDRLPAGLAGANFGWRVREGRHCFSPQQGCREQGFIEPVVEHAAGKPCNSITGGAVYRGACVPDLQGLYLYSDFCQNDLRAVRADGRDGYAPVILPIRDPPPLQGVSSFGVDGRGELYVLSYMDGSIHRFMPGSP